MNIPLIAITPTTAKMVAKYHEKAKDDTTRIYWLRIALILHTVQQYNDGFLTETTMHNRFRDAFNGSSIDVLEDTKVIP